MSESERWCDIPDHHGYQVSSHGRVRSVDRTLHNRHYKGRLLKTQRFRNGYLFVQLGRKSKTQLVHRLVAKCFVNGYKPSLQVNHKNGIKDDNVFTNLEFLTCSDNHKHSYANLTRKLHNKAKIVVLMRNGVETRFNGCNKAANFLGVVAGSIASAVNRNHKCKGYEVRYETCEIECFGKF